MSINVLIVGENLWTAEIANKMSIRIHWPHAAFALTTQATEGLEIVRQGWPDLVLLNPDFSDMPPSVAIKSLRQSSDVPFIVLGSQESGLDAVTALSQGADHYIEVPCHLAELRVRIWSLMRRMSTYSPLLSGRLSVNVKTNQAFLDGTRLPLTPAEFRLLYLLVKNRGAVVLHEILEHALSIDNPEDRHQKLLTNMRSLRRKLELRAGGACGLVNVRKQGYTLNLSPLDQAESLAPELVSSR